MPLIERRIGLLFFAFAGLLCVALVKASYLGALRSHSLQRVAATQQVAEVTIPAPRGTIVDRHGVELAVSQEAADIAVTPYLVKDPGKLAHTLAPLLKRPESVLLQKIVKRRSGFEYLARQVPAARADHVTKLRQDGIQIIPRTQRAYPRGWLGSQLLGTVGTDGKGLSGVEYARNGVLRGSDGQRREVNDALGEPISMRDTTPTQAGQTVQLTIDTPLQDEVEQVLAGVGKTYRPKGATAVVMNPRNGEVLALANWPRVDANDVGGAPAYARQDRAVGFTYEPGSTFKAFTVAGALQEHAVTPHTQFQLPVNLQVADRKIHDAEPRGPETLTVAQILAQSSNVGAVKIGQRLGARRFDSWVRRFGFGHTTGADLPGEEQGIVLPLKQYSGSSMGNLPIGQGQAVTPLQMATGYSAIANGGILRPPHVVRAIGERTVPAPAGRRVLSKPVAASVRRMLEGVLAAGGTASEAAIPGYSLAGKTGTASKPDPVNGGYSNSKYVASFVGFAPARHPRLLVAVMVDEPKGAIFGGVVAAPAFQKIIGFALPYMDINPR
ncbi:MAG: peptidoglycan D,D-transpeptidase FtsI family protein [Solirubrobacteraceae bacterium]